MKKYKHSADYYGIEEIKRSPVSLDYNSWITKIKNQTKILYLVMCELESSHQRYIQLFDECIRQIPILVDNMHISKAAKALWEQLTDDSIDYYSFGESFPLNRLSSDIEVDTYSGNNKRNIIKKYLYANKRIKFNDVFIYEHTTPVADIKRAIWTAFRSTHNEEEFIDIVVNKIYNKLHITRILRTEDARLSSDRSRIDFNELMNLNSKEVFNKINNEYYKPKNIIVE